MPASASEDDADCVRSSEGDERDFVVLDRRRREVYSDILGSQFSVLKAVIYPNFKKRKSKKIKNSQFQSILIQTSAQKPIKTSQHGIALSGLYGIVIVVNIHSDCQL